MYRGAALELNDSGRLTTIELHEPTAKIAEEYLQNLGVSRVSIRVGRFQNLLDGILKEMGTVDYVFIDGHHDEDATVSYFEQVLKYLAPTAVIIFDDIFWSVGMKRAWTAIQKNSKISLAIDMDRMGICVVSETIEGQHYFKSTGH